MGRVARAGGASGVAGGPADRLHPAATARAAPGLLGRCPKPRFKHGNTWTLNDGAPCRPRSDGQVFQRVMSAWLWGSEGQFGWTAGGSDQIQHHHPNRGSLTMLRPTLLLPVSINYDVPRLALFPALIIEVDCPTHQFLSVWLDLG